jgi:hypothetical protein
MRRLTTLSILTVSFVLLAVFGSGVTALAVGSPPGGFIIPIGSTANFTNISFGACNSLSWGYQLNGGSNQVQATFPGGCGGGSAPNVTIGPFATPTTLRVFMTDNHCHFTYYSDGTPVDHVIVSGSNPWSLRFADSGGFCEHTTTTLNSFQGCNFCVTLTITDQAITASGTTISASEGKSFTGTVATFNDGDTSAAAADYAATISWGDGSSSAGTITGSAGQFTVSGTHTYAEEGAYQVTVKVTDVDTPSNTATANSTAKVADAALTASPACSATTLHTYQGPTASFSDAASPSGTLSDFSATINWGDGTTAAGTVTGANGGPYAVSGSHTYATTGTFTITTTVKDVGGSVAVTSCSTVGFSFAPGGGSFVIGNKSAALGKTVTFWGARWAEFNSLSGGEPRSSFKGFAEIPKTPACGIAWSADPGNSTPPPNGPLPAYMGVIVTSSASDHGPSTSGNTVHIVVIKTAPGYAPDPGHSGTGTVVAVVC